MKKTNENSRKKKKTGRYVGIFLAVLVVAVFCLTIGLSACSNDVPDEEMKELTEATEIDSDKDSTDKDKQPAKDDTDKDSTDKDKKPAKPSEKPDKETDKKPEESKKPEKNPAPDVKPDKPSKPTPAPTPKPTDPPTPKPTNPPEKPDPTPPTHVHTWEDVTEVRTTGYNEEQVLVEEAYDEQIEIGSQDVCNGCGMGLGGMSEEQIMGHLTTCGAGYHCETLYQTIHHDAVYETVKTPITETVVVGRRCTSCGTYEPY